MEVRFDGTVTTPPSFFYGTRTHAEHEQFDCRREDGSIVRVIDNVDLAPRIPVVPGDRVTVQGELVHDPGRPPIVHWTHHDPAGQHVAGFIERNGQRYS
jgi:Protein of unknown function (DUF3465)